MVKGWIGVNLSIVRSTAKLQNKEIIYDQNYYDATMKVFESKG